MQSWDSDIQFSDESPGLRTQDNQLESFPQPSKKVSFLEQIQMESEIDNDEEIEKFI